MADIIGVLGEQLTATTGTTQFYQCPVGKAARVRLFYRAVCGANSTFKITVNGIDIFELPAQTAGDILFSSTGFIYQEQAAATSIDGSTAAKTVAPYAIDYFLSAGDILSYTIGGANMSSCNVQAVGIEVDVS